MNEQQKALMLAKMDIEKTHGSIGGFVFDHVLHTLKLMGSAEQTSAEYSLTDASLLSGLDPATAERLKGSLATAQSRAEGRTKQIIVDSHNRFLGLMGKSGIKLTYGYSGDKNEPKAKRTIMLGDMTGGKGVADIDLSKWLTIGVELY